ncbi:Alpha/beta hydrolase fold-containing protein 14 [Elsinoe fawcettii]|nr:Alpha/beta hydrolase fold-containing protein 14 [Elsinoe fawcettii]
MSRPFSIYHLGEFALRSGQTLPLAFIAYRTFGDPSNPAIIYPTWFSGKLEDNCWLIGEDKALNPDDYFIIVVALFGNGESASPSNMPTLRPFPTISYYDNVRAQHQLVTQHLDVQHAFAVLGWSMGAAQTYQWGTQYPEFMDLLIPFCGSAKTSLHNQVFLEGVKSTLIAAKNGSSAGVGSGELYPVRHRSWTEAQRVSGLKAMGRVYSGWGFSQTFYRQKLYETELGYKDLNDFLEKFWEAWALSKGRTQTLPNPDNLLTMLYTWQTGDCSDQAPYHGNFEAAMRAIQATTLVLPCLTDLYFPSVLDIFIVKEEKTDLDNSPEDSEYEVFCMTPGVGTCEAFPSVWGHWAGGPGQSKQDVKWLDDRLRQLFANHRGVNGF